MSSTPDQSSRLQLSGLKGSAAEGTAVLGAPSVEDQIAARAQLADNEKRVHDLERKNAELKSALDQRDRQSKQHRTSTPGRARHLAHAEGWQAICTAPDFCKVGKDVVAFNSFAALDKRVTASANVKARGTSAYRKGDVIKNVQGDAGKHVVSGTSLGSGHVKILEGHDNVKVNGVPVARHDSRCLINCDAAGVGGAQGKLVTEEKSTGGGALAASSAPPGERTSATLEALMHARERVSGAMVDFNAADGFIDFRRTNEILDELISQVSGTHGSVGGYTAQVARGLLGFAKDMAMGTGELLYEGIKAAPKLVQLTQSQTGQLYAQLDAQILAERIRLGNITAGSLGDGALNIGRAIVKPVTDPWAKGQHVESLTRGATEVGTLGLGWLKGGRSARATVAVDANQVVVTKASVVARTVDTLDAAKIQRSPIRAANDGVHVKVTAKPKFSDNWENYKTHGLKVDPMESAEGRKMVRELEQQGYSSREALETAKDFFRTGSTLPIANPMDVGDKFYKIVPRGGAVGPNSAFWATREDVARLAGMEYDQIADRLGLPLATQPGTSFEVWEITAFRPGTTFTSVIAPTTEIGANGALWSQGGNGVQTLLTDRSLFTTPKLTGTEFP